MDTSGINAFSSNQLTNINIGANVSFGDNVFSVVFNGYGAYSVTQTARLVPPIIWQSIGFETAYNRGGRRAGKYLRLDKTSTDWTRQE